MKWISVKERLPEETRLILASDGEQICISFLSKEKKRFIQVYTWDDWIHDSIKYWMPLPELPEKEESHPRDLANDLINELAQKKAP